MQIEYKYAIGQEVFFKTFEWKYETNICVDCGGTAALIRRDGQEIICPSCKGKQTYQYKGKRIEMTGSASVEHIEIHIEHPNSVNILYFLDNSDEYNECEIFGSEADLTETFETGLTGDLGPGNHGVIGFTGDYRELFSKIPKEDWGVHRTHCCKKHGCKYGDHDNCPVCLGLIIQDHLCEDCDYENLPF
jgi:hypothetical protein